jgi:hypothetical protein
VGHLAHAQQWDCTHKQIDDGEPVFSLAVIELDADTLFIRDSTGLFVFSDVTSRLNPVSDKVKVWSMVQGSQKYYLLLTGDPTHSLLAIKRVPSTYTVMYLCTNVIEP